MSMNFNEKNYEWTSIGNEALCIFVILCGVERIPSLIASYHARSTIETDVYCMVCFSKYHKKSPCTFFSDKKRD